MSIDCQFKLLHTSVESNFTKIDFHKIRIKRQEKKRSGFYRNNRIGNGCLDGLGVIQQSLSNLHLLRNFEKSAMLHNNIRNKNNNNNNKNNNFYIGYIHNSNKNNENICISCVEDNINNNNYNYISYIITIIITMRRSISVISITIILIIMRKISVIISVYQQRKY